MTTPSDTKTSTEKGDIPSILSKMETAVLKAADRLIQAGRDGEQYSAWRKEDSTIVTSLDMDCDRIIRESLGSDRPVLSEEDPSTHELLSGSEPYLVIDPIDGTSACRRFLNARGGQVGFGPLAGYVHDGKVICSTFYNVPHRTLYSAMRGGGTYQLEVSVPLGKILPLVERSRVLITREATLESATVLFFVSDAGEAKVIERLKTGKYIESFARFGGFANDCSRLALGYEEVQLQFSVRPWDFPATLLGFEAGARYVLDPLGARISYEDWHLQWNNPILGGIPELVQQMLNSTVF